MDTLITEYEESLEKLHFRIAELNLEISAAPYTHRKAKLIIRRQALFDMTLDLLGSIREMKDRTDPARSV